MDRRMAAISPAASVLRNATRWLMTFLFPSCCGPTRTYRREDHYMRGPGPAWRAKHSSERTQGG